MNWDVVQGGECLADMLKVVGLSPGTVKMYKYVY